MTSNDLNPGWMELYMAIPSQVRQSKYIYVYLSISNNVFNALYYSFNKGRSTLSNNYNPAGVSLSEGGNVKVIRDITY